jgi:hypothetical protein
MHLLNVGHCVLASVVQCRFLVAAVVVVVEVRELDKHRPCPSREKLLPNEQEGAGTSLGFGLALVDDIVGEDLCGKSVVSYYLFAATISACSCSHNDSKLGRLARFADQHAFIIRSSCVGTYLRCRGRMPWPTT